MEMDIYTYIYIYCANNYIHEEYEYGAVRNVFEKRSW